MEINQKFIKLMAAVRTSEWERKWGQRPINDDKLWEIIRLNRDLSPRSSFNNEKWSHEEEKLC